MLGIPCPVEKPKGEATKEVFLFVVQWANVCVTPPRTDRDEVKFLFTSHHVLYVRLLFFKHKRGFTEPLPFCLCVLGAAHARVVSQFILTEIFQARNMQCNAKSVKINNTLFLKMSSISPLSFFVLFLFDKEGTLCNIQKCTSALLHLFTVATCQKRVNGTRSPFPWRLLTNERCMEDGIRNEVHNC